jgi:alkaline phosphatase D
MLAKTYGNSNVKVFRNGVQLKNTLINYENIYLSDSNYFISKLLIKKLEPASEYELRVYNNDDLLDTRSFKTMPTNKSDYKIALASCFNQNMYDAQIWDGLLSLKPDLFLMLGDNMYADLDSNYATPAGLTTAYTEARKKLAWYHAKNLVPTLMIWDDHDYGMNNGGANYEYREQSKALFNTFSANNTNGEVYFKYDLPKISLFFLDGRSFRTKNDHLGSRQLAWLNQGIAKNNRKYNFLLKGDQFSTIYHPYESYANNHRHEYHQFLDILRKYSSQSFILFSGDRHLSEILNIPELDSYEITSSPMHSKTYKEALTEYPAVDRIKAVAGENNFLIVDTSFNKNNCLKMNVSSIAANTKILFKQQLKMCK